MIIYMVKNKINGKIYIGQTTNSLYVRKKLHYKKSKTNPETKFHRALKKYSEENFEWEIIVTTDSKEHLNELEIFYIQKYDSFIRGYNMTLGGEGGDTISMKTTEEKKNQGVKKGHVPWNKGVSMKELGYIFSHNSNRPKRTFTDDQRKEHSALIKNSENYKNGLKNRTPAKQVIIRDNLGNVWNRQKDLIEYLGVSHHKVRKGLKNGEWEYDGILYQVILRK